MTKFYSQNGEDAILNKIFKNQKNGFFIEVGCIDGKRFSNTLMLEEKGWKGMCIEAHSDYIDILKKNRPNSIICHCAASEKNENNISFYANDRGSLSSLDKSQGEIWKKQYKKYFTGFKKQTIKKRRLDYLFKKYNIKKIDVLSIDVEGHEIEVLKGINFNEIKPRVLIIESESKTHEDQIDKILLPLGYYKSIRLNGNIFYLLNKTDHRKIHNKKIKAKIIYSEHPLDKNGDQIVKKIIDTRPGYIKNFKKIKQLIIKFKDLNKIHHFFK